MPVSREEVIDAYRLLLNRDPEGEAAIESHRGNEDWRALRESFMACDEYRYANGYLDRWIVAPVFSDTMLLWVNMRDKYVSIHCVMDAYEPENSALVRKLVKPGDVVLDLGANVGWFSLLASSIVGATGHIHSFEPQPVIARYLSRTITLNGLNRLITLHRAGTWHQAGTMQLAWAENAENHGASHLMPETANIAQSDVVDLVVIDSLDIPRCDFIKMDIEGAEPNAMKGAAALLKRCRPIILSEMHEAQLAAVSNATPGSFIGEMAERGYRCLGTRGDLAGRLFGRQDQLGVAFTDVLFVPEEKLAAVRKNLFGHGE